MWLLLSFESARVVKKRDGRVKVTINVYVKPPRLLTDLNHRTLKKQDAERVKVQTQSQRSFQCKRGELPQPPSASFCLQYQVN